MIEVRLHGRGGQGAVTAAELVAQAVIAQDKYAQAFPNFGPERRGAPVSAFLRISDTPIYLRERIDCPDIVIVLDNTLLGMVDVADGLKPGGTIVINGSADISESIKDLAGCYRIVVVDASKIAMETLGVPITNTAIIGALSLCVEGLPLESLYVPFEKRFGKLAAKNIKAMNTAADQAVILNPDETGHNCTAPQPLDWITYLKSEAMLPYEEVEIGCDVSVPGSSSNFETGNWRTAGYPSMDTEKCIACGICWIVCPDMAFQKESEKVVWDGRYCKGCGICVTACPKKALSMEVE